MIQECLRGFSLSSLTGGERAINSADCGGRERQTEEEEEERAVGLDHANRERMEGGGAASEFLEAPLRSMEKGKEEPARP